MNRKEIVSSPSIQRKPSPYFHSANNEIRTATERKVAGGEGWTMYDVVYSTSRHVPVAIVPSTHTHKWTDKSETKVNKEDAGTGIANI
jgi:hypothetical protein